MKVSRATQLDFLAPSRSVRWESLVLEGEATVGDIAPDTDAGVVAVLNGKKCDLSEPLQEGDFASFVVFPGDPKSFTMFLLQIAVTQLLIKWLMPDTPEVSLNDSTTYGFTGTPNNRYGEGFGMPVIYGEHRTGGVVVGQFSHVKNIEAGMESVSLFALSEGPVKSVAGLTVDGQTSGATGLMINGNAGGTYYGFGVEAAMGDVTGYAPTKFFGLSDWTTVTVNQEIQKPATTLKTAITGSPNHFTVNDAGIIQTSDTYVNFSEGSGSAETKDPTSVDPSGTRFGIGDTFSNTHTAGGAVSATRPITSTPDATCNEAIFNIVFPRGLYKIDTSNGGIKSATATIMFEAKRHASSSWTTLGSKTWTDDRSGQFFATIETGVDVASLSGLLTGGETSTRINFQITRTSNEPAPGSSTTSETKLHSIVLKDPGLNIYPYTAWLYMDALPSVQLNGSYPKVSAIVQGRTVQMVASVNGSGVPTFADAGTQYDNPAWIALDLLMDSRYGAGRFLDTSTSATADFDWQSFIDWAAYCEELVPDALAQATLQAGYAAGVAGKTMTVGNDQEDAFAVGDVCRVGYGTSAAEDLTIQSIDLVFHRITWTTNTSEAHLSGDIIVRRERRHVCGIIFETDTSVWAALEKVLRVGRGNLVRSGKKFRAVFDHTRDPVQLFTESNMVEGTFKFSEDGKEIQPNSCEVTFWNKSMDYKRDVARAVSADASGGDIEKVKRVELRGITRLGHAYREAHFQLWTARLLTKKVEFEAGLDSVVCEAGDRIQVQHRTFTRAISCRIRSAENATGVTTVTLDEDLVFPVGLSLVFRTVLGGTTSSAGSMLSSRVANPPTGGTIPRGEKVTLVDDLGSTFAGMPCSIGVDGIDVVDLSVDRISLTEDLTRKLSCRQYREELYADITTPGEPPEPPESGSGNTWTYNVLDSGSSDIYDGGTQLESHVRTAILADGSFGVAVEITWIPPIQQETASPRYGFKYPVKRVFDYGVSGYSVWVRTDTSAAWSFLAETKDSRYTLPATFQEGTVYVCVTPNRGNGDRGSPSESTATSITLDLDSPVDKFLVAPPKPSAVIRELPWGVSTLSVEWTASEASGVRGSVPDYWEARRGNSWITGLTLGRSRSTSIPLDGLPPSGGGSVWVRSRLKSGVWSAEPLELSHSIDIPKGYTSKVDQKEQNLGSPWGGTRTTCSVSGSTLIFTGSNTSLAYETATIDGTALGVGERRVAWIDVGYTVDETRTFTTLEDVVLGSEEGNRYTFEGKPDERPVEVQLYLATSTDGTTWTDYVQASGPVEFGTRYLKAKMVATRDSGSRTVTFSRLRTLAVG